MKYDSELIAFADKMSKDIKGLGNGEYYSTSNTYKIKLTDTIIISCGLFHGRTREIIGRVSTKHNYIEFNKSLLTRGKWLNENYIFWLILWFYTMLNVRIPEKADIDASLFYKTTGRNKHDIITGWLTDVEISNAKPNQGIFNRLTVIRKSLDI